jgi:hypothetical protein
MFLGSQTAFLSKYPRKAAITKCLDFIGQGLTGELDCADQENTESCTDRPCLRIVVYVGAIIV